MLVMIIRRTDPLSQLPVERLSRGSAFERAPKEVSTTSAERVIQEIFCPFSFYVCFPNASSFSWELDPPFIASSISCWYKGAFVNLLAEHYPPVAAWPASSALQWAPKSEGRWW